MEKNNSGLVVAECLCYDENKALESITTNFSFENCKITSKTTKQQPLIPLFWKPTFDSVSSTNWDFKKKLITMFQNAARQVVLRNRIKKYLLMLRGLKSCSSSRRCLNYCVEKTADDVEALKFGLTCQFPILSSKSKEICQESFMSADRDEICIWDLPKNLHPRLPFVYKRLEYYPSNLMDISNCHDNYLRLRKYVANDDELCSTNELWNDFYGALKSDCGLETLDMSISFKQWNHLPPVFHKFPYKKNLQHPRRMNYADSFLSSLPLPTVEFNVNHCN